MEERRKIKSRIIFLFFFIALTAVAAGLWKDWKEMQEMGRVLLQDRKECGTAL